MVTTTKKADTLQTTPNSDNHKDKPKTPNNKRKNPEHLKPYHWKPGQSGNPKGRPKRTEVLTDMLWAELRRKDKKAGETKRVLLVRKLVDKAIAGDMRAQQIVIERLWGKAPDNVNISGQVGQVTVQLRELLEIVKGNPEHARNVADTLRASISDRTGAR